MSLSKIEAEIIAAGEKVRALAEKGALELRKSKLAEELQQIEEELAKVLSTLGGSTKAAKAKPAAKEAPAKTEDAKPDKA